MTIKLTLISVLLLTGVASAEVFMKRVDDVTAYAKWKCKKYDFYAFTDQERDDFITKNSKSSNTLTVSDFTDISVGVPIVQPKVTYDDLVAQVKDLEARLTVVEKK